MTETEESRAEMLGLDHIVGETEIEIVCSVGESEPDFCDGWETTIELDEPAYLDEWDNIRMPGFNWPDCESCGQHHDYIVNGTQIMNEAEV